VGKLLLKSFLLLFCLAFTLVPLFRFISIDFYDRFYNKFTYKAPSLILGSSISLNALNPDKINSRNKIARPFLNFAFTQATSPYGEIYHNAILKKIADHSERGTFIVEVSPLSLSSKNDSLPETEKILGRLFFLNMDPNIEYVLKNSQHPYYLFFCDKPARTKTKRTYYKNGWQEDRNAFDTTRARKDMEKGVAASENIDAKFPISEYRMKWLEKTVTDLSARGRVILLRAPLTEQMTRLQDKHYPAFNKMIQEIANRNKVPYLNFSFKKDYSFYDAIHMSSASANQFSLFLSDTLSKIIDK
jgi:hypothetical protein